MNNNTSSFLTSVQSLIKNVNTSLDIINGYNSSLTTEQDSVIVNTTKIDEVTGQRVIAPYTIISYNNLLLQVANLKNTLNSFISGGGLVLGSDGKNTRKFVALPLASAPSKINSLVTPVNFNYKNNWFFEDMVDPQMYVTIDLLDRIDNYADRVIVKRIIISEENIISKDWFNSNIYEKQLSLTDVYSILNKNNIMYDEDDQVVDFPIAKEPYKGQFTIKKIESVNGKIYYYVDKIEYAINEENSPYNIKLSVGDELKLGDNTIFVISEVNSQNNKLLLSFNIGTDNPKVGDVLNIYSPILHKKEVDIAISYNEYNIILIKAINEYYNIESNEWSQSIAFHSNDLMLEGKNNEEYILSNFYAQKVKDYSILLEGDIREGYVPAFFGMTPNAPTLNLENFKVVQINTQFNSVLDTSKVLEYQKEINNLKQSISSLKNTINEQKRQLVEISDPNERQTLQKQIDINNNKLTSNSAEFASISKALLTVAYENNAINVDPKYKIRGFFNIPTAKYRDNNTYFTPEEIIQFEIAYRYLRLDNTGNPLNTFSLTDPSSGQIIKGVYSDWNTVLSPIKSKVYDSSLNRYIWQIENISDGDAININQVDISIQKGEKVEFKVRSISEAGWPLNPKKSSWSNSIIMEFPNNLESSNQVVNAIDDAKSDEINIAIDQTLGSTGLLTHIGDSIPNPNAASGNYFKHQSKYIGYDQTSKDGEGKPVGVKTLDLQYLIDNLSDLTYISIRDKDNLLRYVALNRFLQHLADIHKADIKWEEII